MGNSQTKKNKNRKQNSQYNDIPENQQQDPKKNSFTEGDTVVAIFDYIQSDDNELSFKKGDRFVLQEKSTYEGWWWLAKNISNKEEGLIPSNFLVLENNKYTIKSENWFFGNISKAQSETMLSSVNQAGCFLLRESETSKGLLSLSVFIEERNVNHYRVNKNDNNEYYIRKTECFLEIKELIEFYIANRDGYCPIQFPCPKSEIEPLQPSNIPDEWEINPRSLTFGRQLGSGNFGIVFEGTWNRTREVAIKQLHLLDRPIAAVDRKNFLLEASNMKKLNHESLLKLFAVCTESEPYMIVTELMCKGDLLTYLQTEQMRIELKDLLNIAVQIANGMWYLEGKKIVHRDLAARNILVGKDNKVKIADFGLTRVLEEQIYSVNDKRLPIRWTAPEALNERNPQFTCKSDVWSYGVLMYEIVTRGEKPYKDLEISKVKEWVTAGNRITVPSSCNCPAGVSELMSHCWQTKPEDRPFFAEIISRLDDLYYAKVDDDWEIDPNTVKVGAVLGKGNFGIVHKGKWNETIEVAIKMLVLESPLAAVDSENFLLEAKHIKKLQHPNLVKLHAVCTKSEPYMIITEYMCNGDLSRYLIEKCHNAKLDYLLNMAVQVASGMIYLESKSVVHRDLAARNILVGEKGQVKIADFGLLRYLDGKYYSVSNKQLPFRWTAPEALDEYCPKYTCKSDVWSFGILMFEIITLGGKPYYGLRNEEINQKLRTGYRLEVPASCNCPDEVYDLMLNCWEFFPNNRPSFSDIKKRLNEIVRLL